MTVETSAAPDRTRLGFIGLGVMGQPMAGHLASAGYPLTVFDIDAEASRRLTAIHPAVTVADGPGAVGSSSDIVITMLPDGEQVRDVTATRDGLAATMHPGSLLLDTSSAQPWLTRATAAMLAERGVSMVDAPVSGAQWGAEQADLVFIVGGDDADVARVEPILHLLGRAVHHVGPIGSGHVMKSINNTITAMTFLATAEGLVLGVRAGLDPAVMNQVLNESTGGSWITRNHIDQRIISGTYDDPFKLELMVKDVAIATQLADELSVPLPYAMLCRELYEHASEHAGPGRSLSELVRWVEHSTGVRLRDDP